MNETHERLPNWVGPVLAFIGILGVLLAGVIFPVEDGGTLKMSCFWAMRAVLVPHTIITACGLLALLAATREGIRNPLILAIVTAVTIVLLLHVMVPVMPHNSFNQRTHDLLALATIAVAGAGLLALSPEMNLDRALDELAEAEPGTDDDTGGEDEATDRDSAADEGEATPEQSEA